MVDLVERIEALLHQEVAVYGTVDYLDDEYQKDLSGASGPACHLVESSSQAVSSSSSSGSGINESWREKIVEWCYQVVDHFDFSREVVTIAIHYLDRFLAKTSVDKKLFQLAAMTCLFLAIKVHDPGRIGIASMVQLSRGYFMVEQMKGMELELLRVLGWLIHPPTAYCFSKHILFFMPFSSISTDIRHDILELSRFLTELSVIDYFFVSKKPSSVALAALLNSMQEIAEVSEEAKEHFAREVQRASGLSLMSPEVIDCRERLQLLYAQGGYMRPEPSSGARIETISPVCVSYGLPAQQPEAFGAAIDPPSSKPNTPNTEEQTHASLTEGAA